MWKLFFFLAGFLLLVSCSKKESDSNPLSSGNQDPVINKLKADPETIRVGMISTITCDATDPDGDQLAYSWEASLGYILGSGSKVQYTAASCCIGENTITATVEDGRGGKASKSVKVVVLP